MKHDLTRPGLWGMIVCLTICQLSAAQAGQRRSSSERKAQLAQSASQPARIRRVYDPNSESMYVDDGGITRESFTTSVRRPKTRIDGLAQIALNPVPESGDVLLDLKLGGSKLDARRNGAVDANGAKYPLKGNTSGSGQAVGLQAAYGLTKNFYVGAAFEFEKQESETKVTMTTLSQNTQTKTLTEGFSEPRLFVGVQTLVERTRWVGELATTLPAGANESKEGPTETKSDAKSGGTRIEPRAMVIHDTGSLRMFSQLGYQILGDRESETIKQATGLRTTSIERGGNTLTWGAGVELPQAQNLGFTLALARIEDSQIRNRMTGGVSETGARNMLVAGTSLGIRMATQALLVPQVIYMTQLGEQTGPVRTEQVNVWNFALATKFKF